MNDVFLTGWMRFMHYTVVLPRFLNCSIFAVMINASMFDIPVPQLITDCFQKEMFLKYDKYEEYFCTIAFIHTWCI